MDVKLKANIQRHKFPGSLMQKTKYLHNLLEECWEFSNSYTNADYIYQSYDTFVNYYLDLAAHSKEKSILR